MNDSAHHDELGYSSTDLARAFLHSAVVLDDLAYMPVESNHKSMTLTAPNYATVVDDPDDTIASDILGVGLDANAIIGAFAEIGTICAVLKPESADSNIVSEVATVAAKADITVLDWKIHDSRGGITLAILKRILQDDENRHRLRLVAIYTGEPGRQLILSEVEDVLEGFYSNEVAVIEDQSVSKGPIRVVILSKGVPDEESNQHGSAAVAEQDLPHRLLVEFASMTDGLLPTVALSALTAIRSNVHTLLRKFDRSLDPAYLGHRLLLSHPPNAEDHLISALGAELLSMLENERSGKYANSDCIEVWLREHQDLLEQGSNPVFGSGVDVVDGWKELLELGVDGRGAQLPSGSSKSLLIRRSTEMFASSAAEAHQAERSFAVLLQLRTRHPEVVPRLRLGSVVKRCLARHNEYLLCLQPKCDSVRLEGWSGFPFLPLKSVQSDLGRERFRMALEIDHSDWLHLDFVSKPSELITRMFLPENSLQGEVVASKDSDDQFYFVDRRKYKYYWMAEMKEEHALGIAAEVATSLARPGPDDSEWLRRAARRKKTPGQ